MNKRLWFHLFMWSLLAVTAVALWAQGSRGFNYHVVQVHNEDNQPVTDITGVTIYAPGTNASPAVYKDRDLSLAITIPMTGASTNTTLSNGSFYWYGQDSFDVSVTSTTLGTTRFNGLTASNNRVTVPRYLAQLASLATVTVELTNAQIKALNATPVELVPAPGADKIILPIEAVLILDYGTNVLTESTDNLAIGWDSASQVAAGEVIEATAFITAAADTITNWHMAKDEINAASTIVNKNLCLKNTGDGNYGGNAGADTTMTVIITYQILTCGL